MARITEGRLTRALVVEAPDPTLDAHLRAAGFTVHRHPGGAPDGATLRRLLAETRAEVLFKRSRTVVDREAVAGAPELRMVQLCCIGDDSVDKQACADHGVLVCNDPVSNGRSVVELAVGHLVALSRGLYETDAACRAGRWEKSDAGRYEVLGKTLGVLGLGNIGRGVARAAEALGMRVLFHDRREVAVEVGREMGWTPVGSVVELFRASDAVSVHVSAEDEAGRSNAGLLDGGVLEQLGAERPADGPRVFLNLARGFLHSAESLRAAVAAGAVRRAAVDVYPEEPAGGEPWVNPYANLPAVAVSPHIGASTREAQPRIAARVAQTVAAFSAEGTIRDCVWAPRARLALDLDGDARAVLVVLHKPLRGTKRAIDEVLYEAGASNLASVHRDIEGLDVALDIAALDRPLPREALEGIAARAARLTGDAGAVRSVRLVPRG